MKREELIKSREYLIGKVQIDLFNIINKYIKDNNLNRTKFATELGVSKGYISQVLNGDFDHKISKLVDMSLAVNKVPIITFEDPEQYLEDDSLGLLVNTHSKRPIIILEVNNASQIEFKEYEQEREESEPINW